MTESTFGAAAPLTPHGSVAPDIGRRRKAEVAWLIARFVRRKPVRYEEYTERFGPPRRPFCCEVAALRDAGIRRGSDLLREGTP